MRVRTAHFACLLVLLSAFGAGDAVAQQAISGRGTAAQHVLLLQAAAVPAHNPATASCPAADEAVLHGSAARTQADQPSAMRPPVAHSVEQHAVTGSGL